MAIGTLSVNVAANTPRANAALQATAGLIRTVGRSGEEAGPGVRVLVSAVKALAAPAVAGAAVKGLQHLAGAAAGLSVGQAAGAAGRIASIVTGLARVASIFVPGGSLIRLLALGGAALGIRAANKEVTELVERLDYIGKRAGKIGIAVEALDQLRFAARMTGVESSKLDTALEKMNIRIAEAARGGGEAVGVLAEMGLSAQQLNSLPTEKKLLAIADGLKQYGNQSEKLRVAAKLFEEEGTALVQTLAGGSQAVKALMEDAAQLGSPTQGMATAAAQFADQTARAEKTWQALGDKIGATLLPLKTALAYASSLVGKAANLGFDAAAGVASAPMVAFGAAQGAITDVAVGMVTDGDPDGKRAGALTAAEKAAADARMAKALAEEDERNFEELRKVVEKARAKYQFDSRTGAALQGAYAGATGAVGSAFSGVGQWMRGIGSAYQSFEAQGMKNAMAGLNPLTGLAATGPSDARLALEMRNRGPIADRLNSLVEADSREGYMALRANQRNGRDNPVEKKVEANTKRTADGVKQTADAVTALLGLFKNTKPPARA